MYTRIYIHISIYGFLKMMATTKNTSNAWRAEWFWVSFRNRNGQKVLSPESEHYVFDVSFTMNKCRKWKTCYANSLPFCHLGFRWFLSPLFSFFLGLNYDEPGSNSSLQGSPKRTPNSVWNGYKLEGISSWQVLNLSGLHDALAIFTPMQPRIGGATAWFARRLAIPWGKRDKQRTQGDLEASNFWNTHSQGLRIVAIQMIWQNCMGSGWQSLIGWIFSVAIVSSAVLAAVFGDQIAWMFYH